MGFGPGRPSEGGQPFPRSEGTATAGTGATYAKPKGQRRHEFFVSDNGRNQIHYVNEFDPSKNWTTSVEDTGPNSPRAIQIVDSAEGSGGSAVLVSVDKGFVELDPATGVVLRKVATSGSVTGAVRLPNDASSSFPAGTTVLARNLNPPELAFVDPNGADVSPAVKMTFAAAGVELRKLERNSQTGHLSFTKYEDEQAAYIYEVTEQGTFVKKIKLPPGCKGYNAIWLNGGDMQVSTGAAASVITLNAAGQVSATVGGKGKIKDAAGAVVFTDSLSGFHRQANGNVVVANWIGHQDPANYPTTPTLLEFTPTGELVWSWDDRSIATLVTNVYVLE
jgi:hypothetical protein